MIKHLQLWRRQSTKSAKMLATTIIGVSALVSPIAFREGIQAQLVDVASIHETASDKPTSISPPGANLFTATNASFSLLLSMAFGIESYQLQSAPKWIDTKYYDVTARPTHSSASSYSQMRPFLQELLRERFALAWHWQDEIHKGYVLVQRKPGQNAVHLQAGSGEPGNVYILADGLEGRNVPLATLAAMLSHTLECPVIDETSLSGSYDIHLRFDSTLAENSSLPSVFAALNDLGLELRRQPVKISTLIIDHVNQQPSDN